jgi:hypothetical protein
MNNRTLQTVWFTTGLETCYSKSDTDTGLSGPQPTIKEYPSWLHFLITPRSCFSTG